VTFPSILDPVLFELMDPTVRRVPATFSSHGRETRMFEYAKPFDSSMVIYLLDILVLTLRFGGQGLTKVARATPIKKASQAEIYKRAFASECFVSSTSSTLTPPSGHSTQRGLVHGHFD